MGSSVTGCPTRSSDGSTRPLTWGRSEEHTSELQSQSNLVCRLLLEKKKTILHDLVLVGLEDGPVREAEVFLRADVRICGTLRLAALVEQLEVALRDCRGAVGAATIV